MKAPLQEDLIAALRGNPMTIKQAADAVLSTPRSVQQALAALEKAGKVCRRGSTNSHPPSALFHVVRTV